MIAHACQKSNNYNHTWYDQNISLRALIQTSRGLDQRTSFVSFRTRFSMRRSIWYFKLILVASDECERLLRDDLSDWLFVCIMLTKINHRDTIQKTTTQEHACIDSLYNDEIWKKVAPWSIEHWLVEKGHRESETAGRIGFWLIGFLDKTRGEKHRSSINSWEKSLNRKLSAALSNHISEHHRSSLFSGSSSAMGFFPTTFGM